MNGGGGVNHLLIMGEGLGGVAFGVVVGGY